MWTDNEDKDGEEIAIELDENNMTPEMVEEFSNGNGGEE